MGAYFNGNHISGNFNPITKSKPKNWIETGYKIIIPFSFKWRHKIGKVNCDCTECEEHFQPYYGFTWYHSKECSLMKHIEKYPQIGSLPQFCGQDLSMIAQTE